MKTYFTSESVTCGHPDKVCDQIADAVLDDILARDPDAHVACEVTACIGEVHLMGEITSSYVPDYESASASTPSRRTSRAGLTAARRKKPARAIRV